MDIRVRKTITIGFFLFFFIASPILLLYASGYRYDFKRGTLLRTGNIFIEAKDLKEATIFIDDKQYKDKLNQKLYLQNLIPGDYTIRIEKQGYNAWEKKLNVQGTLTTFVKDIILFLNSKPEEMVKGPVAGYSISPNYATIAYVKNINGTHEIWLHNTIYSEDQLLYRSSELAIPSIEWAKSSNRVMIRLKDRVLIYQTSITPYIQLANLAVKQGQTFRWDGESDSLIAITEANRILRFDLVTQKIDPIFTAAANERISDSAVSNGRSVLALIEKDGTTSVETIDNTLRIKKELFSASGTDLSIIENSQKYLILGNRNNHKLYLVKKGASSLRDLLFTEDNVTLDGNDAHISPDESSLLITNDYEISILDLTTRKLQLINRFGQSISHASWYPDNQHLLIAVGNTAVISDLNIESQKTTLITIMSADTVHDFQLLTPDTAIVHASLNGNDTLYTIKLR